jgi:hypothetical protein
MRPSLGGAETRDSKAESKKLNTLKGYHFVNREE